MSRHGERPETGLDQRVRFPLRHCFGEMHVRGTDPNDHTTVELVDLSFSGVGFTTRAELKPGEHVVIAFGVTGLPNQTWDCRVQRCSPLYAGTYHVGATFAARAARARKAHAHT